MKPLLLAATLLVSQAPAAPKAEGVKAPKAAGVRDVVVEQGGKGLPKLPVQGAVVASARFTDKTGRHIVVVTETDEVESKPKSALEDPLLSKHLYGYHFVLEGKAPKQLWHTKDFVKGCPFDLSLRYLSGSLEVTDLDDDGEAETAFAYVLSCRSDVSPDGLKLLLHEGATKLAVRGTTRAPGADPGMDPEIAGGEMKLDPAFDKAPRVFASWAKERFMRYQPWDAQAQE